MICHLCPKPALYICGDIDRPMCEEHAHHTADATGETQCCAPRPPWQPQEWEDEDGQLPMTPNAAADVLRAYLALHEGRVGQHWIYAAIGRMVQGDPEAEVMGDHGWVRPDQADEMDALRQVLLARDAALTKLERVRTHVYREDWITVRAILEET